MTSFDERKNAYAADFAHHEEIRVKSWERVLRLPTLSAAGAHIGEIVRES